MLKKKPVKSVVIAALTITVLIGLLLWPAQITWPQQNQVLLVPYSNTEMGAEVLYIDTSVIRHQGDTVFFRYEGDNIMCLRLVTETRSRRLWGSSESLQVVHLNGVTANKYVYSHDLMNTIAYVIHHKGKLLGIEFRTDGTELTELQQRILQSLKLS